MQPKGEKGVRTIYLKNWSLEHRSPSENSSDTFLFAFSAGWVACLLEEGQRPPTPAGEGTRTAQVNVRLTSEEKVLLETAAKRKGFSGLSDFVRAAAIESAK